MADGACPAGDSNERRKESVSPGVPAADDRSRAWPETGKTPRTNAPYLANSLTDNISLNFRPVVAGARELREDLLQWLVQRKNTGSRPGGARLPRLTAAQPTFDKRRPRLWAGRIGVFVITFKVRFRGCTHLA